MCHVWLSNISVLICLINTEDYFVDHVAVWNSVFLVVKFFAKFQSSSVHFFIRLQRDICCKNKLKLIRICVENMKLLINWKHLFCPDIGASPGPWTISPTELRPGLSSTSCQSGHSGMSNGVKDRAVYGRSVFKVLNMINSFYSNYGSILTH